MTVLIEKSLNENDPAALAGAHRVGVIVLESRNDTANNTPASTDLQVFRLCRRFLLSMPLARVIAEHAFRPGGQP